MVTTRTRRATRRARFTRADYARLPEGLRAELIDGALVKEPSPTGWHQGLVSRLHARLASLVGPTRAIPSPIDVFVGEHDVLQPDVAVLPEDAPVGPETVEIALPVVVFEVLSPSTAHRDRREKPRIYLRAGVREVWLVDPDTQTVEIVTPAGATLFARGALPRSEALPGFTLDLAALFG